MVRRSIASKVFAVWLLILAASPRASLATFDFSDRTHRGGSDVQRSVHDDVLLKSRIESESVLAGVPVFDVFPLFVGESPGRFEDVIPRTAGPLTLHCVLRL
jgi:hypothetical protein